jgi:hypothetical protein
MSKTLELRASTAIQDMAIVPIVVKPLNGLVSE